MSNEIITKYCDDCDTHYQKTTGKTMATVGLDPISIITAILAIITQLCPKPATALKDAASAKGEDTKFSVRYATRLALREKHGFLAYGRYNGDAIANAVMETTAESDPVKMQSVLDNVIGQ